MMTAKVWRLGMGKVQLLAEQRHARAQLRKHVWIISLIFVFILFLISAYIYPRQSSSACYIFSSRGCKVLIDWLPLIPAREHTDKEIASHIVIKEILTIPLLETRNPKIAFMFLNPGSLHFERLWDRFFRARFLCLWFNMPLMCHFHLVDLYLDDLDLWCMCTLQKKSHCMLATTLSIVIYAVSRFTAELLLNTFSSLNII
ncbi:hypothetical protein SAY87_007397 [Trapa incisa]|uniref:Uncharacterized protein n=1 Tax=Trapa incisa TaxID=236973 RepID=A0AAN7K4E6_9MYRT|nr:hypothetical protein SAY87_007397 [Trapa incisa]